MRNRTTKKYVTPDGDAARVTKSEASRRLGVSRAALDRMLARPGAPTPDKTKRYSLAELAAFVASQAGGKLDNLRDARLEEVQLRCERLRRELARDARETVTRAEVNELLARMGAALRSLLYSKLENEMPPKMAGCDALAHRQYGRALADELVSRLSREVDQWNSDT